MVSALEELTEIYIAPLRDLLNRDDVNEICVNRFDCIIAEINGEFVLQDTAWDSEHDLQNFVKTIAKKLNQSFDLYNPILDARLEDGTRINAVRDPVSTKGCVLSIRPYPKAIAGSAELLEWGAINSDIEAYLHRAILDKKNIVVSGGTGSGKTTLIRFMANMIPKDERVIVVEDTTEHLLTDHNNYVELEAANRETDTKSMMVNMGVLINNGLRMRPDRMIVGEIRNSDAAKAFLKAINTGHDGMLTTIHANCAQDVPTRLLELVADESLNIDYLQRRILRDIDLIIWIGRKKEKGRSWKRVREIVELNNDENGTSVIEEIFVFDDTAQMWIDKR